MGQPKELPHGLPLCCIRATEGQPLGQPLGLPLPGQGNRASANCTARSVVLQS